jgi:two-component system cell cycle sensor histidine kinase/response regulator CckA
VVKNNGKDDHMAAADSDVTILDNFRDIVPHKQTQAEPLYERDLLRTVIDNLPDAIYVKDTAARKVLANPADVWNLGCKTESEVLGKTDFDLFPKEIADYFFHDDQLVLQTGEKVINREEKAVLPNGEEFWLLTTKVPWRDADGNIIGLVGIGRNITVIKEAEARVALSEQRLNAFFTNAPAGLVLLDTNLRFVQINDTVAEINGVSIKDHLGKTVREVLPKFAPMVEPLLQKVLATGEPLLNVELSGETPSQPGVLRHWMESFFPIFGKNGSPDGIGVIFVEITERRKLEEQLRQVQKMEAIGQLAGGVAHDFNNILAVIQLQAGLLKSEQNLSLQQLDMAGEIEKAAQRAANLTRQLLLFSHKQALHLRDLDLNEAVTNIAKMLQRVLTEDIQTQFKFSPQRLLIHADAGMMDQILLNLAVNARDAMPKGGRLIIETSAVQFDEVMAAQTSQARPGSYACVSVTDTGGGISPEILPRIFEPFFTTKDFGKGTGLGLATVFGIVQQHQGWINVYSEVGQGTTFRVYLPLTQPSDRKIIQPSLTSIRGGNETILLVEDDSSVRASVRSTLSRLGYLVMEAAAGVEALEVWTQYRSEIRLLLTDLVMPGGINGKELAQRLLKDNPKLKVLYASGYSADIADKDFILEEGVNFLTKPYAADKLAQTVRNCLDKIQAN